MSTTWRTVVDKATQEANELATHGAEIQLQLGGRGVWNQARGLAERAEATYDRDRAHALADDRAEITRLERAAKAHDTKALDAAARHTELTAEQHLRNTMPEPQHTLEGQLRAEQQLRDHAATRERLTALQQHLAPDPHEPHDPHEEIQRHVHQEAAPRIDDPQIDDPQIDHGHGPEL